MRGTWKVGRKYKNKKVVPGPLLMEITMIVRSALKQLPKAKVPTPWPCELSPRGRWLGVWMWMWAWLQHRLASVTLPSPGRNAENEGTLKEAIEEWLLGHSLDHHFVSSHAHVLIYSTNICREFAVNWALCCLLRTSCLAEAREGPAFTTPMVCQKRQMIIR